MRTVSIFALVLGLATACSNDPSTPTSPEVFDRIEAMTSCADLQAEFDTAEGHGNVEVMKAADARMAKVGCV